MYAGAAKALLRRAEDIAAEGLQAARIGEAQMGQREHVFDAAQERGADSGDPRLHLLLLVSPKPERSRGAQHGLQPVPR